MLLICYIGYIGLFVFFFIFGYLEDFFFSGRGGTVGGGESLKKMIEKEVGVGWGG